MSKNIEFLKIEQLYESYKFVLNAINKGCKEGVYNLDEAYLTKVALSNLEKTISTLDQFQTYVKELEKRSEIEVITE